ncbi:MAG TPA: hypothetical protein VGR38_11710 [Candidatus Polarisedimenticolia bacterium]|nr:hypothetical protein [Candidatus Polarisedimenticolia bacterium]
MEKLRPGDKIYSSQFGRGEVLRVEGFGEAATVQVRFEGGDVRTLRPEQHRLELIEGEVPVKIPFQRELNGRKSEEPQGEDAMVQEEIRSIVRGALQDLMGRGETELTGKWAGGRMILKPGKAEVQEKELDLDVFFHKIVMVRDQLRVLEQKINSHLKLTDEEKVGLQHYITRCYGSLTTFNALFRAPEDRFGTS